MKLLELRLTDFEGQKSFAIGLFGRSCIVSGENETGKSTLNNAFLWCMFGKDINGKMLDPKPKTLEGVRILGTEPTVECVIETDTGIKDTLTRKMKEVWKGKKGEDKTYEGDEGVYEINGVDVKKKDFDARVLEIVGDLSVFRLIVDPDSFLSLRMKWEERRAILEKLMGETKIESVLSSSEIDALDGRPIKEAVDIAKSALRKCKDRIAEIPAVITGLVKNMPQTRETKEKLVSELETVNKQIEAEAEKLKSPVADKLKGLNKTRTELEDEGKKANKKLLDAISEKIEKKADSQDSIEKKIIRKEKDIKSAEGDVSTFKLIVASLKISYDELNQRTFGGQICPVTNQKCDSLPEFLLDELELKFKENLAEEKKKVIEKAKDQKKRLAEEEQNLETLKKEMGSLDKELNIITDELTELLKQKSELVYIPNPEIAKIDAEIKSLSESDVSTADPAVLNGLKGIKKELEQEISNHTACENNRAGIKNLENEEREKNELKNALEKSLFQKETLQRKWNDEIETKANKLFSLIKWKLSDYQKDGEIRDMCECQIDGIDFNKTLNTGNRINACIDASNTFSKFFGKQFPLFIDNAEAVTKWKVIPENQHIKLKAVDGVKQLEVKFI
jgi:DNA repair exonuclease SbcCD ATPase subunit